MAENKNFAVNKNKEHISRMFNRIAKNYDKLNHLLSFNIDKYWRKKALSLLKKQNIKNAKILDVASGTGDFAFQTYKYNPNSIIGIDIAEEMLAIAIKKAEQRKITNITFKKGDAENIEFENNQFNLVSISFGIRNVEKIDKALSEFYRVTQKDGYLLILEFSKPKNIIINKLYKFYSHTLMPFLGKKISGSADAYNYLPNSVEGFITPTELCKKISDTGYTKVKSYALTFGVCTVYIAKKE